MTVQAKYIYLARRHPSLSRDGFTKRWRRHGALGMSMPRWKNVRRYVHCDTLPEAIHIAGVRNDFDGVGMIWYRALEARNSHTADHSSQAAMEADEAETFYEPVINFGVLCAEQVQRDIPPAGLKLIRFMFRPESVSEALFEAAWERHTASVQKFAEAEGCLRRYVCNRTMPPELPEGWGLNVQGIEEMWFDNEDDLERLHYAIHAGLNTGSDDGAWVTTISVVTTEVVLYDKP